MARPLLHVFFPLAMSLLLVAFSHPDRLWEDVGGGKLEEVGFDLDPSWGDKGEALLGEELEDRSDQVVLGGWNSLGVNQEDAGGEHTKAMMVGNLVFPTVKRSSGSEERQMNGKIRILRKRDKHMMDNGGRVRILRRPGSVVLDLLRFVEDQNMERRLLKRGGKVDGRIRILKKRA